MRLVVGLRCLPTIFYGMLTVLIPLLLNDLTGSKVMVAAYGTINLIVASGAQLLAGRAADRWGARIPSLAAYAAIVLSGLGLAASHGTVWGLFVFGVLGIAAAWSLSTMMYVWVSDGIPQGRTPGHLWAAARGVEPEHDHRLGIWRVVGLFPALADLPGRRLAQYRFVISVDFVLQSQLRPAGIGKTLRCTMDNSWITA